MARSLLIDFFGLAFIAVWAIVSAYLFYSYQPNLFQRMGAFGTASAVIYFAFVQWPNPYPAGLHDKLAIMTDRLNDNSKFAYGALRNNAVVAGAISDYLQSKGEAVPLVLERLAAREAMELDSIAGDLPYERWEKKNAALTKTSKDVDEGIKRGSIVSVRFQAVVVAVSTLQAGFGDYVVEAMGA